jgi:hypothetical protein
MGTREVVPFRFSGSDAELWIRAGAQESWIAAKCESWVPSQVMRSGAARIALKHREDGKAIGPTACGEAQCFFGSGLTVGDQ